MGISPAVEPVDFGAVDIDARDVVAAIGETGAGDETDVAGANDCDFHAVRCGKWAARGEGAKHERVKLHDSRETEGVERQ